MGGDKGEGIEQTMKVRIVGLVSLFESEKAERASL